MPSRSFWDRRSADDRRGFAALLAPLIVASRTKDFEGEKAKPQLHVWMISLHDVPRVVLEDAITALVQRGVTWMPKPGDLRAECAAVVDARRRAVAPAAQALIAECVQCDGSGWEYVKDAQGVERAQRCGCHRRSMELIAGLPEPIALPPAEDDQAVPA